MINGRKQPPQKHSLKHWVFWPTFGLLASALILGAVAPTGFKKLIHALNSSILEMTTPLFSAVALLSLLVCAWVLVSPLGAMRIGGKKAQPILSVWEWFTIVLCTTTAAGILFWAMAEPIFHFHEPPASLNISPGTHAAQVFAMKSLFHNWALVPCALYCVFAVLFAFVIFQMKLPFALSSCLHPILGRWSKGGLGLVTDGICLFALVSGMAASMGAGILMLAGGTEHLTGYRSGPSLWIFFGTLIVATFITSALAGLKKGIQALSEWNVRFFGFLVLFILVAGPGSFYFPLGMEAFKAYIVDIIPNTLLLDFAGSDPWPRNWTVFYWANWLAWAPVTALFLARIGYGYTYRSFVLMNLVMPAFLCGAWVMLFGGTALWMDTLPGNDLYGALKTSGAEAVTFSVLGKLPLAGWTVPALLFTAFLAYVTAADSNTVAMAGISTHGIEAEKTEPPHLIKILWGSVIGLLAIGSLCSSGLDGIRGLSVLGGFPVLFLAIVAIANLIKISFSPKFYDQTEKIISIETASEFPQAPIPGLILEDLASGP